MSSLGIFDKETKTYKKVAGTAEAAVVDDAMSSTSTNPVQNKVIKAYVDKEVSENVDFSTSTSKLLNDTVEAPLVLSNATRNLLIPTLATITQDGVTCTNNGDGTYTLNGTSTKDRWISFGYTTLNPGKYKFIATENNVEVSNLCVSSKQTSIAIPGNIFTIQSKSVCDIGLSTMDKTFNNVLIKPMITTDLDATYDDFVPYSGYEIKTCGKNLLIPDLQTVTKNGITCTNNGDGTYTFNGTSTEDNVFFDINKNIPINKGTKYKLVCFKDEDYVPSKIISHVRRVDTVDGYTFNNGSFVADSENCWLLVSIAKGVTVSNLVAKPMLTTDLNATYDNFIHYQDGGTIHIDSTTEFPLLGLKSFDGVTNIISPGNVEVTYAKSDSGKAILDMSENKLDKDNVVNNQTTTEEGFALDARQANPNVEGSLGAQIKALNSSLNSKKIPSFGIENIFTGTPFCVTTNGEVINTTTNWAPDNGGYQVDIIYPKGSTVSLTVHLTLPANSIAIINVNTLNGENIKVYGPCIFYNFANEPAEEGLSLSFTGRSTAQVGETIRYMPLVIHLG